MHAPAPDYSLLPLLTAIVVRTSKSMLRVRVDRQIGSGFLVAEAFLQQITTALLRWDSSLFIPACMCYTIRRVI
jgi:hypothetical protein